MTAQASTDMLRRLAALAACVVLLAAVSTGSVYVTTLPGGADVWFDGVYVGRSPVVLDAVASGHHTVGLSKTGWSARQLDVSVEQGQTTLSSVRLARAAGTAVTPARGTIAVRGVEVRRLEIDGVAVPPDKDGTYPAATGTHEITVETRAGRATRDVTVWPQTRTDVVLQTDAAPVRPTVVAPVEDFLPKSAIRIDGERIVIRYAHHEIVGRVGDTTYRVDGRSVDYEAAPTLIGARLYLPAELLQKLFGNPDQ